MRDADGDALIALVRRKKQLEEARDQSSNLEERENIDFALERMDEAIKNLKAIIICKQDTKIAELHGEVTERESVLSELERKKRLKNDRKTAYHKRLNKMKSNARASQSHQMAMSAVLVIAAIVVSVGIAVWLWSTASLGHI